jgi:hypothetical protein
MIRINIVRFFIISSPNHHLSRLETIYVVYPTEVVIERIQGTILVANSTGEKRCNTIARTFINQRGSSIPPSK